MVAGAGTVTSGSAARRVRRSARAQFAEASPGVSCSSDLTWGRTRSSGSHAPREGESHAMPRRRGPHRSRARRATWRTAEALVGDDCLEEAPRARAARLRPRARRRLCSRRLVQGARRRVATLAAATANADACPARHSFRVVVARTTDFSAFGTSRPTAASGSSSRPPRRLSRRAAFRSTSSELSCPGRRSRADRR
jgi:hypothetical protein